MAPAGATQPAVTDFVQVNDTSPAHPPQPDSSGPSGTVVYIDGHKLTDVALATDLVRDAAAGLGDSCILVSTDTDFHPAIEACLALTPARQFYIACPPGRHSPRNTFDGRVTAFLIPEEHFAASQLPAQVRRGGHTYARPEKWQ